MSRSPQITRSKTHAAKITIMSNIMQYKYGLKGRIFTRSFTNSVQNEYEPLNVSGYLFSANPDSKKPVILFNGCLWEMI